MKITKLIKFSLINVGLVMVLSAGMGASGEAQAVVSRQECKSAGLRCAAGQFGPTLECALDIADVGFTTWACAELLLGVSDCVSTAYSSVCDQTDSFDNYLYATTDSAGNTYESADVTHGWLYCDSDNRVQRMIIRYNPNSDRITSFGISCTGQGIQRGDFLWTVTEAYKGTNAEERTCRAGELITGMVVYATSYKLTAMQPTCRRGDGVEYDFPRSGDPLGTQDSVGCPAGQYFRGIKYFYPVNDKSYVLGITAMCW